MRIDKPTIVNGILITDVTGSALKGILFESDVNLFRASANVLKTEDSLVIGGTNVTIEPSADSTTAFLVKDASGNTIFVLDNDTPRLGLGGSPSYKFHILGAGASVMAADTSSDTASSTSQFLFRKSKGTSSAQTAVTANHRLGGLSFAGHDGTDMNSVSGAIVVYAAEDFSSTAEGSYITFETTETGTTTRTEKMRVTASGSVGIGVTSPTSTLDVNGDIETASTGAVYFGSPTVNNSWRLIRSGDYLEAQKRVSGVWTTFAIMTTREKLFASRTYYVRYNLGTVTISIASPAVVTKTAHGLEDDDPVVFTTTDTLPTGITAGTIYYVKNKATDTFEISTSVGGASVNTSGTQAGTHSVQTGNDSNDGRTASRTGALLTIQKGIDIVSQLDVNTYTATIQLADSYYKVTGSNTLKNVTGVGAAGTLVIQGNATTPQNVFLENTSGNCFYAVACNVAWDVKNMKLSTITSGSCIYALDGSYIRYSGIDFGTCAGTHVNATNVSIIRCLANCWVSGSANTYHWFSTSASQIYHQSRTLTFLADVSFSYFSYATFAGTATHTGSTFTYGAYTVTTTGGAYYAAYNGIVYGAGVTLPGTGGSTASGGQYG